MKFLVFSHGFGVRKDDRGLLSDIAAAFPDYKSVLFDYNQVDKKGSVLTVAPLSEQAIMLNQQINKVRQAGNDSQITLVCHSQGCVAAALANPQNIKQIIFLTPPGNVSPQSIKEFFAKRPGTVVEDDGTLRVPRKDGSTTRIPSKFLDDMFGIDVTELYSELAKSNKLTVIVANQDEVIKPVDFGYLDGKATLLYIDGNHNFTGDGRAKLLTTIQNIIK